MGDPTSTPTLDQLRAIILRRWWVITALLWPTVGGLSLWALRLEIAQLRQYFTWATLRYGLAYHRLAAVGLGLCVGLTVALLVEESRYILFGLAGAERQRLQRLADRIAAQGTAHPLWHRLHRDGPGS